MEKSSDRARERGREEGSKVGRAGGGQRREGRRAEKELGRGGVERRGWRGGTSGGV